MKYFSPSYWFKLWVLSAPLFNSENQGINAKSIYNKKIKDWASNNTSLESINQEISFTNSSINYQPYNLNETNQNIDTIYQTELETSTHKHRHEKSRRIKKQVTPNQRSREIKKLNEKLIINRNNPTEYQSSIQSVINELVQNDILLIIPETNNELYVLNPESNYDYFRLPVTIRREDDGQSWESNLELVLSSDALYVQGFIINERGSHIGEISNYYYFNPTLGTSSGQYNPQLTTIPNTNPIMLNHIGNAYRDMLPREDTNINWISIFNSFVILTNDINVNTEPALGTLARSLGRIILVTAEVLRFREWENTIIRELINNRNSISIGLNNNNYQLLIRWGQSSQTHLTLFLNRIYNEYGETDLYLRLRNEINQRLNRIRNPIERNFMTEVLNHLENTSIDTITTLLFATGVRILLLRSPLLDKINRNCRRGKRDLQNTYWNKKFCDWKPQIDKIQGKITTIKILDKNNESDNLKHETIYIGTTNGVYMINTVGQVNKFNGLNFPITNIKLDGNGSAYAINEKCEIYHLNLIGWGSEKLEHMESCDLKKELKLYFWKKPWQMSLSPQIGEYNSVEQITLNLKKINPIDNYKKIEFLGDVDSNCWGTMVNWGNWVYTNDCDASWGSKKQLKGKSIKKFLQEKNNNFHDIIENGKWISSSKENILQSFYDKSGEAKIDVNQRFGLTWYWENEEYYLKVFGLQYCEWWASYSKFDCHLKLGDGIRLYNVDDKNETQIPNPNDRKRREIFEINKLEEKNLTKWTDDFTKSINNEQHLLIDNKANFVANNITSL